MCIRDKLTSIPYIVINLMLKTESKYGRLIKLRAVFSRYTNKNTCEVISPYMGAKMDLIRLANQNAQEEVERATTREERQNKLLEALGKMLGLEQPPRRMESYDISNQGASDIVASMVVYVDGRPLKRDYRRFKLKETLAAFRV